MIGECTSRGGRSLTMVFSASVDVAFRVLGALGFNVGALIIRIGFHRVPLKRLLESYCKGSI